MELEPGNARRDIEYYRDGLLCFVPSCKKHRRDFPTSAYLSIPKSLQAIWCQALGIYCPKRNLYVCQDHINIVEDCYRSKSGKLHLKKTANLILTKTYDENEMLIDESNLTQDKDLSTATMPMFHNGNTPNNLKCDSVTQTDIKWSNKAVSVKPTLRSIGCSTNIKVTYVTEKIMPSQHSSSTASSSSTRSLYEPFSSPSSSSTWQENGIEAKDMSGRAHILKTIEEYPKMYVGVPKSYYWLLEFLSKECNLRLLHVIITLFKLKQNDSILRLSHQFQLSKVTVQEVLRNSIPKLATFLQMFIYLPEPFIIKKTLPPVYKVRYANVQCILDCFEIQIEKASNTVKQSSSWSNYKWCNTVKYLLACCPNGFICFISKGIGGRISDKAITERSGFVDILPPGAVVLADRGFKGIEPLLAQRHAKLLRPPTVSSKETPSKAEVIQTKVIASLRVHVERVIRRLREFSFLEPHSTVNHNHVKYVDEAVLIASALVNLQSSIIKIQ